MEAAVLRCGSRSITLIIHDPLSIYWDRLLHFSRIRHNYHNISHAAVPVPYRFQKYSGPIIQPDFDSSRRKKRSAVWQNTFVQSCHLQQQCFAALYFVVSEYHGKSKEMITAIVFRITGADNSIIQQKTCKAKLYRFFGTPEGTRTPDLLVRSQSLYPTELPAHTTLSSALQYNSTHALKMQVLF